MCGETGAVGRASNRNVSLPGLRGYGASGMPASPDLQDLCGAAHTGIRPLTLPPNHNPRRLEAVRGNATTCASQDRMRICQRSIAAVGGVVVVIGVQPVSYTH